MFFNLGHFIWSSHALMKMAVFAARRSFCKFESQNKIDPTPSRESEETGSGFIKKKITSANFSNSGLNPKSYSAIVKAWGKKREGA
ncbi:MAG: hypothetical protein COS40_09190 [Deltaproteobacteria bacterium CG03_land_8_20_14_0_80_45_14]|nr:MAG: hypothetical protein COS40_09190 [Deltaproteobacteria bacterium CG03_land_8_20_14_0_80_45_14]